MLERLQKYSVQLVSLFLIIVSFQLIRASVQNKEVARFGARLVQSTLAPFESSGASLSAYFSDIWTHYVWLRGVVEEKNKLEEELVKLKQENADLREKQAEVQSLRDLLDYKESYASNSVLGTVISRNFNNWSKTIVINRGENEGLRIGSAVIEADAVVGQVISVSKNTAEVLLLTDALSSIDGLLQNSRISGTIDGQGGNSLLMNFVIKFKDYQIEPGELVVTSGLDAVFPKGIVIGEISEVDSENSGLFQKIKLKPHADLYRLEHVLVLTNQGPGF